MTTPNEPTPLTEALATLLAEAYGREFRHADRADWLSDAAWIIEKLARLATPPAVRCGNCGADLSDYPTAATGHVCTPPAGADLRAAAMREAYAAIEAMPAVVPDHGHGGTRPPYLVRVDVLDRLAALAASEAQEKP